MCSAESLLGSCAQVGLGFHREDFGDGAGVVREVEAVAGAYFDDAAAEAGEHASSVLGSAGCFRGGRYALIHAGEDRMADPLASAHGDAASVSNRSGSPVNSSRQWAEQNHQLRPSWSWR